MPCLKSFEREKYVVKALKILFVSKEHFPVF